MARQQLGTDPTNALDAATRAYVLANKGTGGSGGNGNVYIQQSNPNMTSPGEWWQIDGSGNLVSLWVETATTYASAPPSTGLVHRFRAGAITGLTNGQAVNQWYAEVGGVVTSVPSGATAPTYLASGYNGKPAVTFDGTQNRLSGSISSTSQPLSIVLVMNQKRATTAEMPINTATEISFNTDSPGYRAYGGTGITAASPAPTTGAHSFILGADAGGAAIMQLDGTTIINGNIGTYPMNQLSIGGHPNNLWWTQMDLYEILLYSTNLHNAANAADLATLKSYIRGAYGMTVN